MCNFRRRFRSPGICEALDSTDRERVRVPAVLTCSKGELITAGREFREIDLACSRYDVVPESSLDALLDYDLLRVIFDLHRVLPFIGADGQLEC